MENCRFINCEYASTTLVLAKIVDFQLDNEHQSHDVTSTTVDFDVEIEPQRRFCILWMSPIFAIGQGAPWQNPDPAIVGDGREKK